MDRQDIERFRDPGFTIGRRGYDTHEVDKFLNALVDWLETDAAKELGGIAITRKLELVGKSTSRILLTADEESAQLRRATEEECEELRAEAEAASFKVRQAADEHAANARAKADEDARRATTEAEERARQIVDEGERRRAAIEAVVAELAAQRDRAVEELERLRAELGAAIGTHSAPAQNNQATEPPKPRRSREGAPAKS